MKTWVQISSGRGPAECCWVVAQLAEALRAEARKSKIDLETLESVSEDHGHGFRSVLLAMEGKQAGTLAAEWRGTIKWIGTSPFRPRHKRKNWFVGVEVFDPPSSTHFDLKSVRFELSTSSGPGGQHVNRTETAVRAIHEPTGHSARASNERSQHLNKQLALAKLAAMLSAESKSQEAKGRDERWSQHGELERGNARRIYEGSSFKRVL